VRHGEHGEGVGRIGKKTQAYYTVRVRGTRLKSMRDT